MSVVFMLTVHDMCGSMTLRESWNVVALATFLIMMEELSLTYCFHAYFTVVCVSGDLLTNRFSNHKYTGPIENNTVKNAQLVQLQYSHHFSLSMATFFIK